MEQTGNQHGSCCGKHSGGNGFFIALIALAAGVLVGGVIVTFSEGGKFKEADAKRQQEVSALKSAVEQAWGDGVMWGALAMKNMTDVKQDTREFGSVFQVAKDLKSQFASQKTLPPPAPMLAAPTQPK